MIKKVLFGLMIFATIGILFLLVFPRISNLSKKSLYVQGGDSVELPLKLSVSEQEYIELKPVKSKASSKVTTKAVVNSISLDSLVSLYKKNTLHQDLLNYNIFIIEKDVKKGWLITPVSFSFTLVD